MKILFLASWYPSKIDEYNGDFIQRHAKAISIYNDVFVIFVNKDDSVDKKEIMEHSSGHLHEFRLYYSTQHIYRPFKKLMTAWYYFYLQLKLIKSIWKKYGKADLVHVNVAFRSGVVALWLKYRYNLSYVITEHWSIYKPYISPNVYDLAFAKKWIIRKILRKSAIVLPVSEELAKVIRQFEPNVRLAVIPNTVDIKKFYLAAPYYSQKPFRFAHISSMEQHKNPRGIMEAVVLLSQKRKDFEVIFIGPPGEDLMTYANHEKLINQFVFFRGILSYEQVAGELRLTQSLIVFSKYENQPCVIIEALACGLPVIAPAIGGIPEIINCENGILIQDNIKVLAKAMNDIIDGYNKYQTSEIAKAAKAMFSFAAVGKKYDDLYRKVMNH